MPRKKINNEEKKISFGITIHPKLDKMLKDCSIDKNISKSQLIENIMTEYLKNNNND